MSPDLEASITWWTYPVFVQDEDQADGTYEQTLIRKFNEKYPNIKVELKLLDYTDGPGMIDEQIKAEGRRTPERPSGRAGQNQHLRKSRHAQRHQRPVHRRSQE